MAKLSNINGKFAVEDTGAIRFSDQTGTTGQILKSNGNSAPTWIPQSDIVGAYLPLAGGILTGATSTASGISFTVGGVLTGTTASFTGTVTANQVLINSGEKLSWGTQGAVSIEGSTSSNQMEFRTNSTDAMIIDSSGNINIGPDALDIQIKAASNNSGNNLIYMRGNASNEKSSLQMNHFGYADYYIGVGHVGNGKFNIANDLTGDDFVIDTSGNVGIGGTLANKKLYVLGDTTNYQILAEQPSGYAGLSIKSTTVAQTWSWLANDNGSNSDLLLYGGSSAGTKLTIDSSGNVGITAAASFRFNSAADNTHAVGYDSTIDGSFLRGQLGMRFLTGTGGGSEKMRISSNGRTLITVASGNTIQDTTLQLKATGASDNAGIMFINSGNTSSFNDIAGIASFVESGSAKGNLQFWTRNTDGANTDVATRLTINSSGFLNLSDGGVTLNKSDGTYIIFNYNGSTKGYIGSARQIITGETQANMAVASTGDWVFGTGSSLTERMRITSGGNVNFGKQPGDGNGPHLIVNSFSYTTLMQGTSTANIFVIRNGTGLSANVGMILFESNAGGASGQITTNSSTNTTSYNTSGSDERLKKNITDWNENVLDKFKDIQPKKFHFKTQNDDSDKIKGYIAQNEVDKFPEAYPLVEDKESGEKRYLFNPSGMNVYLMKAIQELKAEIEILKNK